MCWFAIISRLITYKLNIMINSLYGAQFNIAVNLFKNTETARTLMISETERMALGASPIGLR